MDFDDRYFQAAATDQQIPYPVGGEPIELVNLSPDGRISGEIPRSEIVVTFERKSGRVTQRIANLDTVLFLPEDRRMCLTWRTRITAERDLFEFARAIISERPLERGHPLARAARKGAQMAEHPKGIAPGLSVIGFGMWSALGPDGPSTHRRASGARSSGPTPATSGTRP